MDFAYQILRFQQYKAHISAEMYDYGIPYSAGVFISVNVLIMKLIFEPITYTVLVKSKKENTTYKTSMLLGM